MRQKITLMKTKEKCFMVGYISVDKCDISSSPSDIL